METVPAVMLLTFAVDERLVLPMTARAFDLTASILAAMGVTIIASAGDSGVDIDYGKVECGYAPLWPATSPLVLSVGSTRLVRGVETSCSHDAGDSITSGGGFSNLYDRPAWQASTVESYFDMVAAKSSTQTSITPGFRATGRAYPDIAMRGYDIATKTASDNTVKTSSSSVRRV